MHARYQHIVYSIISLSTVQLLGSGLERLKHAYPDHIQAVDVSYVTWKDGTKMPLSVEKNSSANAQKAISLSDQLSAGYIPGKSSSAAPYCPKGDPGRDRYEPFFRKMYGSSRLRVMMKLTYVPWMPHTFGKSTYRLLVTTVNGVHKKLAAISAELDELVKTHPEYKQFLKNPGAFRWRNIAHTNRLSMHSLGIAVDINPVCTHYWQSELSKTGSPISENLIPPYQNTVPWDIVLIFEKHGFIWGGKWQHFDTMHFEYRPELFPQAHP